MPGVTSRAGSARGASRRTLATNVPRPTVDVTKPAASRLSYARTTVFLCAPSSVASERVGGRRCPAGNVPARMRSAIASKIWW